MAHTPGSQKATNSRGLMVSSSGKNLSAVIRIITNPFPSLIPRFQCYSTHIREHVPAGLNSHPDPFFLEKENSLGHNTGVSNSPLLPFHSRQRIISMIDRFLPRLKNQKSGHFHPMKNIFTIFLLLKNKVMPLL